MDKVFISMADIGDWMHVVAPPKAPDWACERAYDAASRAASRAAKKTEDKAVIAEAAKAAAVRCFKRMGF